MVSRKRINIIMILVLGFSIPAFYKINGLMSGKLTLGQLLDQPIMILTGTFFGFGIATIAILGHDWAVRHLRNLFSGKTENSKRFLIQFVFSTVFSISAVYLFGSFYYAYVSVSTPPDNYTLHLVVMGLFIPIVVNGVKESLYYYSEWETEIARREQLHEANIFARYEILKNQVNPHFLFNCLNTLTELIHDNDELAVRFIHNLSQVYRFILENMDRNLVPLEDELRVLDSYVFLMKIRLGDNLQIDMNAEPEPHKFYIVPMTLQVLLENAIKHNIASKERPLHISISITNNELVFKNNLQQKSVLRSTHVGLNNLSERYIFATNKSINALKTPTEYIVSLPLLRDGDA